MPAVDAQNIPHSSNQRHTVTADQVNASNGRYTSRAHEFGPTLNKSSDGGHTNYAWVD